MEHGMWNTITLTANTKDGVVEAFGLPPGRTMQSYFTDLSGSGLGLFALTVFLLGIIYLVFYKRDKNGSQLFAVILMILVVVYIGGEGLTSLKGVISDSLDLAWAYITGGNNPGTG
jgi:hypothetical protein